MAIFPARLRNARSYGVFQKLLRIFQFLSAVVSLALFSARIYKIIRLSRRASVSNGAVEGILAAAVLYTIIATLLTLAFRTGGPNILRWLLVFFDILFVAAFIVVGYLTRPHGGTSGPCQQKVTDRTGIKVPSGANCNLPWGTFVLAILSTIFHALTAIFHEGKDRHYHKHDHQIPDGNHEYGSREGKHHGNGVGNQNGYAGNQNGNAVGNQNGNGGNYQGHNGLGNHSGNGVGNNRQQGDGGANVY